MECVGLLYSDSLLWAKSSHSVIMCSAVSGNKPQDSTKRSSYLHLWKIRALVDGSDLSDSKPVSILVSFHDGLRWLTV